MKMISNCSALPARRTLFVFALLATASALSGADRIAQKTRGVDRGKPSEPLPTLVLGINDATGGLAEPGWPLIVTATRLTDDKAPAAPLPASPLLKVTREDGAVVELPMTVVPRAAGDNDTKSLHWLAAEAATTALAPGLYRVAAATPPAGWRVESGEFRIVAPNAERGGLSGHLRMKRYVLLGQTDDALAEADRMVAARAEDQAAWIAKGDLMMMQDRPDDALAAYDRALALQKKTDREPLAIMTRRRNATQRALEKRGVIAPK